MIDGFLEVIGVHNSDELKQPNLENEGFSREKLEKFVFINRTLSPHLSSQFKDINPLSNIVENKGTKLIESFPDEMIKEVCDFFYPFESKIAKDFLGKEQLFLNKYPKVYGTKRLPYRGLSQSDAHELNLAVNLQKLEVVNKILEEITSQKHVNNNLPNVTKVNWILSFKSIVVRIFSALIPNTKQNS